MTAYEEHSAACSALRERMQDIANQLNAAKMMLDQVGGKVAFAMDEVSMDLVVGAVGDNPSSPEAAVDVFVGASGLREELDASRATIAQVADDLEAHAVRCAHISERVGVYMAGWAGGAHG